MATTIDYINLSSLAYIDFSSSANGLTIDEMIKNDPPMISPKNLSPPELSALADPSSPLRSWTLVGYQNNPESGFCGMAFQKPANDDGTPGEVVFAFRGTESDTIEDLMQDFNITIGDSKLFHQFTHAEVFVHDTLEKLTGDGAVPSYSFTGHSLGGGVAQWMEIILGFRNRIISSYRAYCYS